MAPKKNKSPQSDPNGIFSQMTVFMIETGIKSRRLQVWKQKLVQMGAEIEDRFSRRVTHIFAADLNSLSQKIDCESLNRFKGKVLNYQWLEDSLRNGEKVPSDSYTLSTDTRGGYGSDVSEENHMEITNRSHSSTDNPSPKKKLKTSPEDTDTVRSKDGNKISEKALNYPSKPDTTSSLSHSSRSMSPEVMTVNSQNRAVTTSTATSLYNPPDLNRNITEIFRKLIDIYRALGDDRRSFSYYKAIPVIEKLPFKIESADQVKTNLGLGSHSRIIFKKL